MIGREERQLMAWILKDASSVLGRAICVMEEIGRRDIDTLRNSDRAATAADKVCQEGGDMIKALLEIASTYDRTL